MDSEACRTLDGTFVGTLGRLGPEGKGGLGLGLPTVEVRRGCPVTLVTRSGRGTVPGTRALLLEWGFDWGGLIPSS